MHTPTHTDTFCVVFDVGRKLVIMQSLQMSDAKHETEFVLVENVR